MSTSQISIVLIKHSPRQNVQDSLRDIESFLAKFQMPYDIQVGLCSELSQMCEQAQSHYIIVSNAELSSPLGDAFKLLQTLTANNDIQVVFGNRFAKKDSPFLHQITARTELDLLYTPLFEKSLRHLFKDPLCDLVALRKDYWNKLNAQQKAEINELRWTPFIQRITIETNARTADVPIYDNGSTDANWPKWRRKFKMFWLSSKF